MKAVTVATVFAVALGLIAATVSQAEAGSRKHRKYYRHHVSRVTPQVRGFSFRIGGHQMGYEADPFLYKNGPYGNFPFHDPRNFWERVQSGPFDETTSPSAF